MSTWRARQERHRAVEIDREAALDLVEDDARDLLVALERLLELAPALLAARLVAREHRLAERVLDPLEIDLDRVADLELGLPARARRIRAARTRPSVLAPTSMTARSFSIPTTVPLTTEPSCRLPWLNDSSSIAAKSSRDGAAELAVAVAMNSPGCGRRRIEVMAFRARGPKACESPRRTFGNRRKQARRPGA